MPDATPVRQQYLDVKKQFPNAIVFFRLGDFYETFDGDAEIVARELDIVLTSRNIAKNKRVPMAGVPHHAAENYIARLIDKGYHVAICEQVSDEPIQGLMQREVVRVVTPGTVTEPALLPEKRNNYLAAISPTLRAGWGLVGGSWACLCGCLHGRVRGNGAYWRGCGRSCFSKRSPDWGRVSVCCQRASLRRNCLLCQRNCTSRRWRIGASRYQTRSAHCKIISKCRR